MNDYCTPLNFDLPLFKTELSTIDFLKSQPIWADNYCHVTKEDFLSNSINYQRAALSSHFQLDWEKYLTDDIKKFFKGHGQEIYLCEIFFRYKNYSSGIHSDGKIPGDYSKINWIFGGEDSEMNWYKVKETYVDKDTNSMTPIRSNSKQYTPNDVELAYSENFRGPALIQVGCPHNIRNGNYERFCVSIAFKDPTLGRRPTIAEAKEIFKKYIV